MAKNETLIQKLYQNASRDKSLELPEHNRRIDLLKKELRRHKANASNVLDQIQNWSSGEVPTLLRERLQSLEAKIKGMELEFESLDLQRSNTADNVVDAEELFEFVRNIDRHFSKFTAAERRQFVKAFIGRIELHPEKLHIQYNYTRSSVDAAAQVLESKANPQKTKPQPGSSPDWGSFTFLIGSGGGGIDSAPLDS